MKKAGFHRSFIALRRKLKVFFKKQIGIIKANASCRLLSIYVIGEVIPGSINSSVKRIGVSPNQFTKLNTQKVSSIFSSPCIRT